MEVVLEETERELDQRHDSALTFVDWGLVDYSTALQRQLELVEKVAAGSSAEMVVFCSHPPVVTLGRGTREGDVFDWAGETVAVGRGGRATYHGPNQLVVYPILNLGERGRDLHAYLRTLEDTAVKVLQDFGVSASGRSLQIHQGETQPEEATGVWIGSRKIASLGIGVRKWVSFHGIAMNIERDPMAFQGMKPCGFTTGQMVSLEEALGFRPDRELLKSRMKTRLTKAFGISLGAKNFTTG
jgi:lipoyl(octanoyl) transferase